MFYAGPPYAQDDVVISAPDPVAVEQAVKDEIVLPSFTRWWARDATDQRILYLSVLRTGELVGEIFLHDIDRPARESMAGWHLLEAHFRGRGTGTTALRLLQRYVVEQTDLQRLIAITTRDNAASRAIGRKCGFVEIGPSREDPENGVVMEWRVAR